MTNTTLTSVSPAGSADYGQTVVFTASVSSSGATPTGTVNFKDGSNIIGSGTLSGGVASYSTTLLQLLSAGSHTFSATYMASTDFAASSSTTTNYTVNAAPTTTTITSVSPASPAVYGQLVTLTATVAVTPASQSLATPNFGTVTFKDGSTTLGTGNVNASGVATYTTTATQLAVGSTHSFTAVYGATTNFGGSISAASSYTVSKANTSTTLASSANPSVFSSQSVTFTATVAGTGGSAATPTGTVTFENGGIAITGATNVTLVNGVASFSTSSLPSGTDNITAVYTPDTAGNLDFIGSTSNTVAQQVQVRTGDTTTITGPTSAVYDQPLTFTITVNPASGSFTHTETVQLIIDGTLQTASATLNNSTNQATIIVSNLTVGTHTIGAQYNSDGTYITSTAATPVTVVVSKASTSTAVSSSSASASLNTPVTLTATVAGTGGSTGVPTGSVNFYDGGTLLNTSGPITLTNGTASFSTSTLALGGHTITAIYTPDTAGSVNFTGSTSPNFTQTITPLVSSLSGSVSPTTIHVGTTFTLTVDALNSQGAIANYNGSGSVSLTSPTVTGGTLQGTTFTVSFVDGVAKFQNLHVSKAGTYTLKITTVVSGETLSTLVTIDVT